MNDIGSTQAIKNVSNVSFTPSVSQGNALDDSGKKLPQGIVQGESSVAISAIDENKESVEQAVDSVNVFVQNVQRDLEFTVDKELDKTVIKVVETDSGKLIRQIPEDIFLELARNLKQDGELNLVDALG